MEEFVNRSRAAIKSGQNGQYLIVSGNEACDLDSTAVRSGLCLLQTTATRQCGLSWEALIYADDLFGPQSNFYKHSKAVHLILVDCHAIVGCLHGRNWPVKEVIDHHMLHPDSSTHNLDNCELKRIDAVGSCASLVAAQILSDRRGELLPLALWKLLYGAILLDTIGLSECGRQAGRLTDLDLLMASRIEDMIGEKLFSAGLSRETLFRGLENAKFDIKGLCIWDLLRRDTKLAIGPKNSQRSIVCSTIFGMDFEQLIHSADFVEAAKRICTLQSAVVLVGITVGYAPTGRAISHSGTMHNGRVNRRKGLVVFAPNEYELEFCKQLADHLTHPSSKLDLRTMPCEPPPNPTFDSNNDGGASGTADGVDSSVMDRDSGSYPRGQSNSACGTDGTLLAHSLDCVRQWLSKLEMSERVELVKTCILQVVHDDSPDETTFHPIGILSASVLKQVTDKLFSLMSSHKKPGDADECAPSLRKQLETTRAPESPKLADHLTHPSSKLDLRTMPCEPCIPGVVFTGVIRNPTATRKAVLPALVQFLHASSPNSPPNPTFDSNNDGGASGTADGVDSSVMDRDSGSYWLSKLEMSERVELVKTCILQVVHDDSPDETTFHPIGILSASVLKQVTDKLFLLMSSHKKPGDADECAPSLRKQLETTRAPESPKALSSIGIALNRGRRLTMPASNELKSYHHANLTKGVCSKHSSPKHRASDDSSSVLNREDVKPDWLETEYLTHLPALFPDRLTSRSIDAVEGVSYRLYRRLSAFPRTTQSKSPSSSTDCLESIDELRGSATIEDEAELALLKVSFGDLNQIGGGVLSTNANAGRLSALSSIGIALNRGRRLTMPASNELKSYHHANLTKGVCSKHSSPKHRASDDSSSVLNREDVKPDWLETEYLTHLPALFPDRLTSRSIDAVEGVSYRLYRRLSAFPRTTQSKSPSSSTDCLESIDELRGSATIEDEAELALLKVSFGDLNQIGGGVLSTNANAGRLSVCTTWPSTHSNAVMQRCLECLQHTPQFQQAGHISSSRCFKHNRFTFRLSTPLCHSAESQSVSNNSTTVSDSEQGITGLLLGESRK
ncbi:hypothetical protein AHF37_03673 [Paragonimus kellicotti]|nr:hypothetical protein AHF37_03673 [Paragonimus kellicotti]